MKKRILRWLGIVRLERRIEFLERELYGEIRTPTNSPTLFNADNGDQKHHPSLAVGNSTEGTSK